MFSGCPQQGAQHRPQRRARLQRQLVRETDILPLFLSPHPPTPLCRTGGRDIQGHQRERMLGRLPTVSGGALAELTGSAPCWREDRPQRGQTGPGLGNEESPGCIRKAWAPWEQSSVRAEGQRGSQELGLMVAHASHPACQAPWALYGIHCRLSKTSCRRHPHLPHVQQGHTELREGQASRQHNEMGISPRPLV